jgi:hypothetical protein
MLTAARILAQAGFELTAVPKVEFFEWPGVRGRSVWAPDRLPRLDLDRALAKVVLPLHLSWSSPGRLVDLASRSARARVYEVVLREGGPEDILRYVDGALLVDLWDELVLPASVRAAWAPVVGPWIAAA